MIEKFCYWNWKCFLVLLRVVEKCVWGVNCFVWEVKMYVFFFVLGLFGFVLGLLIFGVVMKLLEYKDSFSFFLMIVVILVSIIIN